MPESPDDFEFSPEVYVKCYEDPQWESEHVSKRPLRGVQAEMIQRIERHITEHNGGVMTILSARQTGKNETAANLQRRHLWRNQDSPYISSWIRTAPTHEPQIINSKKRLEDIMKVDKKNVVGHPMFLNMKVQKSEGYIWRYGNATVEFMSSGPHANVVGATANECLDMDEAHKVGKDKFDEDFAPFTASTNAASILWGVAADGMDTIEWYRENNKENHKAHLNLYYPCDIWANISKQYEGHINGRINALGWDHPIIKTQYRLIPVAHEGTFISKVQALGLLDSSHERQLVPKADTAYEICIDLAAGNEEMNPDKAMVGEAEATVDSTVVWIYEVTGIVCQNNIYPIVNLVNLYWFTGVPLPNQEIEIIKIIEAWRARKVTVDSVGIGRQLGESLELKYGPNMVLKYIANSTTVSEDCFDLLARLNYSAVKMFRDDGSEDYAEFQRQVGWTKYASNKGKMTLIKPHNDRHIDMVKGLTYINRNKPDGSAHQISSVESEY